MKTRTLFLVFLIMSIAAITCVEKVEAKCEAALARLQQAEAALAAADAEYNKASAEYKKAQANLNNAVQDLNAIAAKLGVSGKATGKSITFGRSPSNPTFFDDPGYKAARQAWQDAKDANQEAEGNLDQAGMNRKRAQDERDEAEAEYKRLHAEHVGDEGLIRAPGPLKLDETLTERVEKVIRPKKWHKSIKQDGVIYDISLFQKKTKDRTFLEVSILPSGPGAQNKRLPAEKLKLIKGQNVIDPVDTRYYSTAKKASAAKSTPYLLTGLGGFYAGGSAKTASAGDACHTTPQGRKSQTLGSTLGSVGVASGAGLLAARPKASEKIKGLKGAFDITGHDELKDMDLQVSIQDTARRDEVDVIIPISE